ncbi:MAG TPA: tripartite tricarboxylate transporter substrate binding protein [Xanthobacteraceae bacterium]|nr:tripartite tricarboxylate transporter substrate binding protein [Xanthobacteraceae bacterium]
MRRRDFIGLLGAAVAWPHAARAQAATDYPNRVIKLVHGFPPGGNVDVVARLMAQEMAKHIGQTIIVETKPGIAGNLAAEAVAGAAPDGYTLLLVAGLHPAVAAVYHNLKYDPLNSFAWISTVSFYPFVLCVRKDSSFKTFADLISAARERPGGVTSGTAGNGSISHMTTELIARLAKVKFLDVPYRGEAPALTGTLGGEVDLMIATSTAALPHLRSGALRGIGVTGKTRWKDFPDIPTLAESGLTDFEVISWSGLAAPAKAPQPVIARLHAEIERAIKVPEVRARLEGFGAEVRSTTPAEMRDLVARQIALWTRVADDAGIRLD